MSFPPNTAWFGSESATNVLFARVKCEWEHSLDRNRSSTGAPDAVQSSVRKSLAAFSKKERRRTTDTVFSGTDVELKRNAEARDKDSM